MVDARKAPTTYLVINGDESRAGDVQGSPADRDGIRTRSSRESSSPRTRSVRPRRSSTYVASSHSASSGCRQALNEAYGYGAVGPAIFGSEFSIDLVVHPGAGAYICGEETALIESLEGKRGFPRIKPPYFPAAIGLYGEPTIVNNVETMSNLPWIVINGGSGVRRARCKGKSTGTRLFALAGHVENPGVYELEMVMTTFRDLIFDPKLWAGASRRGGRS